MIKVYTSYQNTTTLTANGLALSYDRGVPTWIPPSHRKLIESMPEFKDWDGVTQRSRESRPIFVHLPLEFEYVLAARTFIRILKERFPVTPIHGMVHNNYKPLFEGIIQIVDRPSFTESDKYYRFYEIADTNKSSYYFDMIARRNHLKEQALLMQARIYDIETDKDLKIETFNFKSEGNQVLIISPDSGIKNDFAQKLAEQLRSHPGFSDDILITSGESYGIPEAIDKLKKSRFIISLSNNQFANLAAYSGLPIFIFLDENILLPDRTAAALPNAKYTFWNDNINMENAFRSLNEFINYSKTEVKSDDITTPNTVIRRRKDRPGRN